MKKLYELHLPGGSTIRRESIEEIEEAAKLFRGKLKRYTEHVFVLE